LESERLNTNAKKSPKGHKVVVASPSTGRIATANAGSRLRGKLEGSFEDRIGVLEAIADGSPIEEVRLDVAELLPHVDCPKCHGALQVKPGHGEATIKVLRTARAGDRIKAVDIIGKYGLGQKVDNQITVVHPDVIDRLSQTLMLIGSRASWERERLIAEMEKIWV
jgi:hypothetical protein